MRVVRILAIGAALVARASVAQCAWTVSADGTCVEKWAPSDLLRGPAAIVNAPLQPLRTTAGGAEYAWNKTEWRWWYTAVLGLGVTGVSAAAGVVEGLWWVCTGTVDLVTGGYFGVAPERATDFRMYAEQSTVITGTPPAPTEDPCGRALVAAAK